MEFPAHTLFDALEAFYKTRVISILPLEIFIAMLMGRDCLVFLLFESAKFTLHSAKTLPKQSHNSPLYGSVPLFLSLYQENFLPMTQVCDLPCGIAWLVIFNVTVLTGLLS